MHLDEGQAGKEEREVGRSKTCHLLLELGVEGKAEPHVPEMLSGNFENKGKAQAGVGSSESIPFIQIRTSPFCDTAALKKEL